VIKSLLLLDQAFFMEGEALEIVTLVGRFGTGAHRRTQVGCLIKT